MRIHFLVIFPHYRAVNREGGDENPLPILLPYIAINKFRKSEKILSPEDKIHVSIP